jgi:hypothetical protein
LARAGRSPVIFLVFCGGPRLALSAVMTGLVTSQHFFRYGVQIIRGFGLRLYLHCLVAIALRRRVTFLHLVEEVHQRRIRSDRPSV